MKARHFGFAALLVSSVVHADYPAQVLSLRDSQTKTDRLISKMRTRLGFSAKEGDGSVEASEVKCESILQTHSGLALRLPSGKLLFGRLVHKLVVGGEVSPALIELDSSEGELSHLRLIGQAKASGTSGRISIEFQKLVFATGHAQAIQALALDSTGASGIEAQVVSQKALAIGGAMASGFIAGAASAQQSQNSNAMGFSSIQPTARNSILQGVAQAAADQSKRLIDEATSEKPILIAEAGTAVTVFVQEEVRW